MSHLWHKLCAVHHGIADFRSFGEAERRVPSTLATLACMVVATSCTPQRTLGLWYSTVLYIGLDINAGGITSPARMRLLPDLPSIVKDGAGKTTGLHTEST